MNYYDYNVNTSQYSLKVWGQLLHLFNQNTSQIEWNILRI